MCTSPSPFNVAAFTPNTNYVIDASAGTGKTYSIVEMVKKMLQGGITLDKILIVTYTDKAAGELKDRIREGIRKLNLPYNPKNDVDTASIGTIHSFCENVIKEFFISAGKPSGQKLIDEDEINQFLKRYIRQGKIYQDIIAYKKGKNGELTENVESNLEELLCAYLKKYYLTKDGKNDIIWFDEIVKAVFDNDILQTVKVRNILTRLRSTGEPKAIQLADWIEQNNTINFSGQSFNKNCCKTPDGIKAYNEILSIRNSIADIDTFYNKCTYNYLSDIYLAWQKEKGTLCEQTFNDMIRNVREEVVNGGTLLQKIRDKYTHAIIDEFQDTNQKQWDIFKTVFLDDAAHHVIVVGDPKQSIYAFQGADVTVYQQAKNDIIHSGGLNCTLSHNYRARQPMIEAVNAFFDQAKNEHALPNHPPFAPFVPSACGNPAFKAEYNKEDTPAFWITEDEIDAQSYAEIVCQRIVDFCTYDAGGETKLQVWDRDKTEDIIKQRNVSFGDFAVLARTRSEMVPITKAFEKYGIPYVRYKDTALFAGKECANWIAVLEAVNCTDFTGYNRHYFRKAMFTYFFGYSMDEVRADRFDTDNIQEARTFAEWREMAQNREWQKLIERIITDTRVAEKMQSLCDLKAFGVLMQIGDYCADYLAKTNNLDGLIANLKKQAKGENDEDEEQGANVIAKSTDADCVKVMTIHASKGLEFPVVISVAGWKGYNNQIVYAYTYHEKDKQLLTFHRGQPCIDEETEELQRLFYVAYTRAKYILMLPQYPCPKKGSGSDKTKVFIAESIKKYKENNPNSYQPLMPVQNDTDALKQEVIEICKKNADGGNAAGALTQAEIDKRKNELVDFGKSVYSHTSQKHAYSSLSHGGEASAVGNAAAPDPTDASDQAEIGADADLIENDALKRNREDDLPQDGGLAEYDNKGQPVVPAYDKTAAPAAAPNDFPAGTGLGNALHLIFERLDYQNPVDDDKLLQIFIDCFASEKIRFPNDKQSDWFRYVRDMVNNVLHAKLPVIQGSQQAGGDFTLSDIPWDDRKNEVEFNFNILREKDGGKLFRHYMNGFVDLIFKRGDRYSILDWKSDRLNDDFTSYSDADVLKTHVGELYAIQRVLYSYCLIKWLTPFYRGKTEQEVFDEHFGGIYYVFLRGCNAGTGNGIYAQTWENFDQLKAAYDQIVEKKVH